MDVLITKVEKQLDKKVKVVRFDKGGEFYKKYNETWQYPGPFDKFLKKRGIYAQ